MDVATALTVAQTLFATLQCAEVRKLCSICNYESELQKLIDTVKTINKFLQDADAKCQELTSEGQYWVENLKDAVYDADDLMDEFNTIAHQLKRMPGGKVLKKVRRFFSSNNQLIFAVNMSREIKKLREKLGSLARNHSEFGFSELYKPVKSREETCSYVYEQDIIGRDADKKAIVDLLVQDDSEINISFVTIVGIGGLGKTALAQLVFNDHRIKEAFQENMYWLCVSENFSMKDILGKMISNKELEFEDLQRKVRNQIEGKRYLLVLDDVWSENGRKWDELKNFLILGGTGTRILVTSRSTKVAGAIGNYPIHELAGLSVEDSWALFQKISLGQREDEAVNDLVQIGKHIVKKCANVPLSIRVIASLLRNQDIATWQSLKGIDLASVCDGEGGIMPTLMFSYYHLATELKSCFSFCSLFPEDYKIKKNKLIRIWMALGYLVPRTKTESMEDVGERYISILLHRCFFQDIIRDKFGKVKSFKMHDLIHELARNVAAKEFSTTCTSDLEGKVRHRFIVSNEGLTTWFRSSNCPIDKLRTCLINPVCWDREVDAVISNCKRLRVLDFSRCRSKILPDFLGKLLHLRYLDLSGSILLEMLPKSITKLHNLQALTLFNCWKLKELPENTSRLVNLRVLDINRCMSLNHMPAGMGQLTSLHTLPMFIVCGDDEDEKGKLMDLLALINNLRGYLNVKHYANSLKTKIFDSMEVQLASLRLDCKLESYYKEGQETLLENMFFNYQFHEMKVKNYAGTKLPSWASGLVNVELTSCDELQYLPSSLSQLCHLKYLKFRCLKNVEYIESDAPSAAAKFFPSLEYLELFQMPKLEGWWREIRWMEKEAFCIPSFPELRGLEIDECKGLMYFPPCPLVKELYLYNVDEALTFCTKGGDVQSNPFSLELLCIDNSCIFNSLGMEFVGSNVSIELYSIEKLGQIKEGFQSCASSLHHLCLSSCRGMENLGIEHLTNLNSLKLEDNIEGIPWESLGSLSSLEIINFKAGILPTGIRYLTSLQSLILDRCDFLGECIYSLKSLKVLEIYSCYKLQSLPEEMRQLTSLATLIIEDCPELKSLPEAIRHLTSLTMIDIIKPSPELKDRCRKPNGEDWSKICHISQISFSD